MIDWTAIGNIGTLLGGAGEAYAAYEGIKQQKEANNFMKEQYNRQIQKEATAQKSLDLGFDSVFGTKKKRNNTTTTPSFDIGV